MDIMQGLQRNILQVRQGLQMKRGTIQRAYNKQGGLPAGSSAARRINVIIFRRRSYERSHHHWSTIFNEAGPNDFRVT